MQGKLYTIGGVQTKAVDQYDPETDAWAEFFPSLRHCRVAHGVAADEESICELVRILHSPAKLGRALLSSTTPPPIHHPPPTKFQPTKVINSKSLDHHSHQLKRTTPSHLLQIFNYQL